MAKGIFSGIIFPRGIIFLFWWLNLNKVNFMYKRRAILKRWTISLEGKKNFSRENLEKFCNS
jgi:hypothetical protein